MPVSKTKRKTGKKVSSAPRSYFAMHNIQKENIEQINSAITTAELIVEHKLPRGECTYADVRMIRDIFDAAQIALLNRKCFDDKTVDEFMKIFIDGLENLYSGYTRAYARKAKTIVYTGAELQAIRDNIIPAASLLKDSFETCPRLMLREWELMLKIQSECQEERIEINRKQVRNMMDSMVGKAGYYIKKRYSYA